jgi:tRNA (guanine10-N2)-methyltransferase
LNDFRRKYFQGFKEFNNMRTEIQRMKTEEANGTEAKTVEKKEVNTPAESTQSDAPA